jgi:hypothetical protein
LLAIRALEVLLGAFEPPALICRLGRFRFGVITAGEGAPLSRGL